MVKINNRNNKKATRIPSKRVTKNIHKQKYQSLTQSETKIEDFHINSASNSSTSTTNLINFNDSNSNSNQIFEEKSNSNTQIYEGLTGKINTNEMTHEEFLEVVRSQAKKLANSKKSLSKSQDVFVQQYILEKSCEICKSYMDDEHMLLCDYCDDAYHSYCLNPPLTELPGEDDDWLCDDCTIKKKKDDERKEKEKRQSQLDEYQFNTRNKKKLQSCKLCTQKIDYQQPECCIKCQGKFHKKCFAGKKNSILCQQCQKEVKDQIPKSQPSITEYFTVKKEAYTTTNKKNQKNNQLRLSEPVTQQKSFAQKKKKNTQGSFKLPQPSKDPKVQMKQKKAFIYALQAKQITFDDDLQFTLDCPAQMNNTTNEPNLQKISDQNLVIFNQFKQMTREGNYAPVLVEEDKMQGFVVRALEDIPERTLLCEYVGQVDTMKNRVLDQNDSIMELLKTARSSTTLVIVPQKQGNLARFLSGINNQSKESRKKQNVQSIRMDINGHARVLLFAKKKIQQGELLYYDYNAGGFDEYPTENFV